MKIKYFANLVGGTPSPFGPTNSPYVCFIRSGDVFAFDLINGQVTEMNGWTPPQMEEMVKTNQWVEVTPEWVEAEYPRIRSLEQLIFPHGRKSKSKSKPMAIIGVQSKRVELDKVVPGQLYYNIAARQVQRIVEVQGRLIWTAVHKGEAKAYGKSSFRTATKDEVEAYLGKAAKLGR